MRRSLGKTLLPVIGLLFLPFALLAQTSDTTILTLENYIDVVLQQHPVAKQAGLQSAMAAAEMRMARGNFDPVLAGDYDEKYFDDKHYYRIADAGFRVPTFMGLTVTGGYENNEGQFLNPENTTDPLGLWSLGVEANLLQGLLIDKRRAALQQARIFQQAADNERVRLLNKILSEASMAYINWHAAYQTNQIILESIQLAENYFEFTRESFLQGDKPAIDTLEALLIVQDRRNRLQENRIEVAAAEQALENYIWYDQAPVELRENTVPDTSFNYNLQLPIFTDFSDVLNQHPEVRDKEFKLQDLEVEQRLKRDKLKPKLSVKYNPLLNTTSNELTPQYTISNYKWGIKFSLPILLRSERGGVEKVNIKIAETELDLLDKRNELKNKMQATNMKLDMLDDQLDIQQQNVINYRRMLEAERERFSYGESSVFVLNSREEKYLESRIKLVKLRAKRQQARLDYLYLTNNILEWVQGLNTGAN